MKNLANIKESLLRRYVNEGIARSTKVIDAFMKVPREDFVPSNMRDSAYDDRPLPIAFGQTVSAPHCLATSRQGETWS